MGFWSQPLDINLASQPFGRERAELAVLAGACALLTLLLLLLVGLFVIENRKSHVLRRGIRADRQTLQAIDREQSQSQAVIGRADNAAVFSKSVFYNELTARRAVSWTRVFDDLARVMPPDVQLVSLRLPQVIAGADGDRNHIELEMRVGTQQPAAVLTLLKNLQASSVFGPAVLSSQQPPTQNDPLSRYGVTVPYVQKF